MAAAVSKYFPAQNDVLKYFRQLPFFEFLPDMESNAVQTLPNSVPVQNHVLNYFRNLPTDRRYSGYNWQTFDPIGAFPTTKWEQQNVEFQMQSPLSPHCFMVQQMVAEVELLLCYEDGSPLTGDEEVSVSNNILNTLFDSVTISVN